MFAESEKVVPPVGWVSGMVGGGGKPQAQFQYFSLHRTGLDSLALFV